MKKFLLLSLALFSINASAYWFAINTRVQGGQTQLTAYADNRYAAAIVCQGSVAGITYSGAWINAFYNNVVIYPGTYAIAYAYTNPYDPFVRFQSNVFCRFF